MSSLAGTARLWRLALRRDRVRVPVWAVATAAMVGLSASSVKSLYATAEQRLQYAAMNRGNAALIVQSGPGYGLDHPSIGAILVNEQAIWVIVVVAVLAILTTTRHSRLEEETARAELVRSAPVGRHAGSAAALLTVLTASSAVAACMVVALVTAGYGAAGAFALAAALTMAGLAFGAITLVAAQVAASSRAATGLGLMVLGVTFVLRAVGDVKAPWLSWLSPIHWAQAVRAYAGEQWLVLALPAVATPLLVWLALNLAARRDFGAGLLSQRPGRAEATRHLATPLALAARLQRGAIIGWACGIASMGFFYGVLTDQAQKMVEDNPDMKDFLAGAGVGSITDAFLATGMLVMGLMAAGFAVGAVLRLRAEEQAGRADPLLAAPVGRDRWAASHFLVACTALVGLLVLGGAAQGLGAAITMHEWSQVGRNVAAGLVMSAGVAVLAGITFVLCTAAPRWALASWAGLVLTAVMGLLAQVLDLPMWVRDASPFQHVPAMPAVAFRFTPVVALVAVTVLLAALSLVAVRRRDLGRT